MKLGDKTLLVQRANIGAKAQDSQMPLSPGAISASPSAASILNLQVPAATLLSGMMLGHRMTSSLESSLSLGNSHATMQSSVMMNSAR